MPWTKAKSKDRIRALQASAHWSLVVHSTTAAGSQSHKSATNRPTTKFKGKEQDGNLSKEQL